MTAVAEGASEPGSVGEIIQHTQAGTGAAWKAVKSAFPHTIPIFLKIAPKPLTDVCACDIIFSVLKEALCRRQPVSERV